MMKLSFALILMMAAGCGNKSTPSDAAVVATEQPRTRLVTQDPPVERPESDPDLGEPSDAPPSVTAIRGLLGARHVQDLPSRATLDTHAAADEALVWLADHGDTAAVRVRALRLLGLYPDRNHGAALSKYAAPTAPHQTLRAAALSALAAYSPADRSPYKDLIVQAQGDADPRVAKAAAAALEGL